MVQYRRIGELLLDKGVITKRQLAKAIKLKAKSALRFGEILTAIGAASEEDIVRCLAEQYDYPIADLSAIVPEPEAVALLEQGFAISHQVLPVRVTDDAFECVISDPVDVSLTDLISLNAHKYPRVALAAPSQLLPAILAAYGLPPLAVHSSLGGLSDGRAGATTRKRRKPVDAQWDREALLAAVEALPSSHKQPGAFRRLLGA